MIIMNRLRLDDNTCDLELYSGECVEPGAGVRAHRSVRRECQAQGPRSKLILIREECQAQDLRSKLFHDKITIN